MGNSIVIPCCMDGPENEGRYANKDRKSVMEFQQQQQELNVRRFLSDLKALVAQESRHVAAAAKKRKKSSQLTTPLKSSAANEQPFEVAQEVEEKVEKKIEIQDSDCETEVVFDQNAVRKNYGSNLYGSMVSQTSIHKVGADQQSDSTSVVSGLTDTNIQRLGGTLRSRVNDVESSYTNTSIQKDKTNRFEGLSSNASNFKIGQAENTNSEFSGQKEIQHIDLDSDEDSQFSGQLRGQSSITSGLSNLNVPDLSQRRQNQRSSSLRKSDVHNKKQGADSTQLFNIREASGEITSPLLKAQKKFGSDQGSDSNHVIKEEESEHEEEKN